MAKKLKRWKGHVAVATECGVDYLVADGKPFPKWVMDHRYWGNDNCLEITVRSIRSKPRKVFVNGQHAPGPWITKPAARMRLHRG